VADRPEVLARISIFGALSKETLEFLHERLEPVAASAGEYFFREKDLGDCVFVLVEGRAAVIKTRGGRDCVLATFEPGACFGEMALLAISPRSAGVRAVTDCRAVRLRNRALYELYKRDLEQFTLLQMNLGREVARRLNETTDLLLELVVGECADEETPVVRRLGGAIK